MSEPSATSRYRAFAVSLIDEALELVWNDDNDAIQDFLEGMLTDFSPTYRRLHEAMMDLSEPPPVESPVGKSIREKKYEEVANQIAALEGLSWITMLTYVSTQLDRKISELRQQARENYRGVELAIRQPTLTDRLREG